MEGLSSICSTMGCNKIVGRVVPRSQLDLTASRYSFFWTLKNLVNEIFFGEITNFVNDIATKKSFFLLIF